MESLVVRDVSYNFMYKNGVFFLRYAEGIVLTLEIAKKVVALRRKYSKNVNRPCVVNITGVKSVTEEATQYFLSEEAFENISALAMIVNTEIEQLLAKFYVAMGEPSIPTKLFYDELNAIRWLHLQKDSIKN